MCGDAKSMSVDDKQGDVVWVSVKNSWSESTETTWWSIMPGIAWRARLVEVKETKGRELALERSLQRRGFSGHKLPSTDPNYAGRFI